MQVTETLSEGLKREIKVVIPAKDMEGKMNERLADAKDRVRINGFRPGKVPIAHLKKMYGKSIMAELVNEIIRDKPSEILTERGEKAATQPEVTMTEDEAEANEILDARADFEFSLAYEVIPPIELKDNGRDRGDASGRSTFRTRRSRTRSGALPTMPRASRRRRASRRDGRPPDARLRRQDRRRGIRGRQGRGRPARARFQELHPGLRGPARRRRAQATKGP